MISSQTESSCASAVAAVPPGRWGVAVSGGADSVALLLLLHARPDLYLHVVHLDHETRNGASADDAQFVRELARNLNRPCMIETRSAVETDVDRLASNPSARFRAARHRLFARAIRQHDLAGVILGHHADDQAETVLHRLLRGSGPAGLVGMSPRSSVGVLDAHADEIARESIPTRVTILRPLLGVSGGDLRAILRARGQPWREDSSNASDAYARNRLRRVLAAKPALAEALRDVSTSCRALIVWVRANTPAPGATLATAALAQLPPPLRREQARRWLAKAGVPESRIDPGVIRRLLHMVEDAATPARQQFPGDVTVRRRRGVLEVNREQD